jgi:hypothetical protein
MQSLEASFSSDSGWRRDRQTGRDNRIFGDPGRLAGAPEPATVIPARAGNQGAFRGLSRIRLLAERKNRAANRATISGALWRGGKACDDHEWFS